MLRQWTFSDPKYMQDFRVLVLGRDLLVACFTLALVPTTCLSRLDIFLEHATVFSSYR